MAIVLAENCYVQNVVGKTCKIPISSREILHAKPVFLTNELL